MNEIAKMLEMNRRWSNSIQQGGEMAKEAQGVNRRWIDDHYNEGSVQNQVVTPVTITPEQLERGINTRTPIMIEEIREGSWAMPVDYSGNAESEVRMGSRYAVTIQKIETARHYYNLEDLWTSKRPIAEQLKEDMGQALIDATDRMFFITSETAVWVIQQADGGATAAQKLNLTEILAGNATECTVFKSTAAKLVTDDNGDPADTFAIQPLRKEDGTILKRSMNTAEGEQLKADVMLVTEYDWASAGDWDFSEVGDKKVDASVEGTSDYNKLKGIRIVRTSKQRFLRPGNIFCWAPWTAVGHHYQVGGVETQQDKDGTRVKMYSWLFKGTGYGNLAGVRKMELFSASDNPYSGGSDTGVAAVRAMSKKHMIVNNRADEGLWRPAVTLS